MRGSVALATVCATCYGGAALAGQPGLRPAQWADPGYAKLVWAASPHFDRRPKDVSVDTIVLHHTAGPTLESTVRWFENPESRVSAHFTVGKDGSIVQHVSTFDRAWHAGASRDSWGREGVNAFSIGIEMVNLGDGKDPWPKEQVEVVGFLIATMRRRFPEIRVVTSHEFVAVPRGRKVDPKGFPWEALRPLGLELVYDMSLRRDRTADISGRAAGIPGRGGDIPERGGDIPGRSGDIPERVGDIPGRVGDIPGRSGDIPGRVGDIPGRSGDISGRVGGLMR